MNHYEMLCVLDPGLGAEGRPAPGDVVKEELAKISAEVTALRDMGRRKLAYQIGGVSDGCYQLVHFAADAGAIQVLRAGLKLNPAVVRFLILKGKGPVTFEDLAESLAAAPPRPRIRFDRDDDSYHPRGGSDSEEA